MRAATCHFLTAMALLLTPAAQPLMDVSALPIANGDSVATASVRIPSLSLADLPAEWIYQADEDAAEAAGGAYGGPVDPEAVPADLRLLLVHHRSLAATGQRAVAALVAALRDNATARAAAARKPLSRDPWGVPAYTDVIQRVMTIATQRPQHVDTIAHELIQFALVPPPPMAVAASNVPGALSPVIHDLRGPLQSALAALCTVHPALLQPHLPAVHYVFALFGSMPPPAALAVHPHPPVLVPLPYPLLSAQPAGPPPSTTAAAALPPPASAAGKAAGARQAGSALLPSPAPLLEAPDAPSALLFDDVEGGDGTPITAAQLLAADVPVALLVEVVLHNLAHPPAVPLWHGGGLHATHSGGSGGDAVAADSGIEAFIATLMSDNAGDAPQADGTDGDVAMAAGDVATLVASSTSAPTSTPAAPTGADPQAALRRLAGSDGIDWLPRAEPSAAPDAAPRAAALYAVARYTSALVASLTGVDDCWDGADTLPPVPLPVSTADTDGGPVPHVLPSSAEMRCSLYSSRMSAHSEHHTAAVDRLLTVMHTTQVACARPGRAGEAQAQALASHLPPSPLFVVPEVIAIAAWACTQGASLTVNPVAGEGADDAGELLLMFDWACCEPSIVHATRVSVPPLSSGPLSCVTHCRRHRGRQSGRDGNGTRRGHACCQRSRLWLQVGWCRRWGK